MSQKLKPIRLARTHNRDPKFESIGQRRLPYDDLYHSILTLSWPAFFLLITCVFVLTNALFALLYLIEPGSVLSVRPNSFEDLFFFSVQTMATIGYGSMAPATRYGHILVTFEAIAGTLSVAITTGLTFAKFARPTARVLFSEKAVICPRNGVPHLMFRMANWRHNQVTEAQLRAIVLVTEKTIEGEVMRKPVELKLVRDRTALFRLSWTAMHCIDETSLFYGDDALEKLRALNAEIYLNISGIDETMAQTVHARYWYSLDDIVQNARFADVLTTLPDGTRLIDYHHFHDVVML